MYITELAEVLCLLQRRQTMIRKRCATMSAEERQQIQKEREGERKRG